MKSDKEFYQQLLGFGSEWEVKEVQINTSQGEINIYMTYNSKEWIDKETGEVFRIYDLREERTWRHLDTLQYKTFITARIPRVKTSDGNIISIKVPYAEENIRHTHMFENKCITVLKATHNQTQTADIMKVSQENVNDIMCRAVKRGLERRIIEEGEITQICIDEKSYGKGQKYVSVLSDPIKGRVLDVERNRDIQAVDNLLNKVFNITGLDKIKVACCDMWDAYITGLKKIVLMPYLYMTNFMLSNI